MPATPPTQMRIPLDLLARIDAAAYEERVTRTAWMCEAARRRLVADSIAVSGQPVWEVNRSPLDPGALEAFTADACTRHEGPGRCTICGYGLKS